MFKEQPAQYIMEPDETKDNYIVAIIHETNISAMIQFQLFTKWKDGVRLPHIVDYFDIYPDNIQILYDSHTVLSALCDKSLRGRLAENIIYDIFKQVLFDKPIIKEMFPSYYERVIANRRIMEEKNK